ncbi:battenin CLN3 protein [Podila horticola]|nr:battenin CLN3 protein [Podila horticola]
MGQTIPIRLVGVMMASLSSGLGEQTFLMLSSFYRLQMVSAWSSGTGGAGLLGSLLFLALTSWIGLSIPATLGVVSMFPLAMLFAYFVMLSSPPTSRHSQLLGYQPLSPSSHRLSADPSSPIQHRTPWEVSGTSGAFAPQSQEALLDPRNNAQGQGDPSEDNTLTPATPSLSSGHTSGHQSAISSPPSVSVPIPWDGPSWEVPVQSIEPTSINTLLRTTDPDDPSFVSPFRDSGDALDPMGRQQRHYKMNRNEDMSFSEKLVIVRSLFWPFMQYVTYAAIYQVGVFISRSSASYIQISRVWIPSFLQVCTLLFMISQALVGFIPWIYLIFAIILWEGLLGGSTYVHTYIGISRDLEHDPKAKEFALGAVGVADGLGITMAGLVSLYLEPALCHYQVVERGIELCLSMAD